MNLKPFILTPDLIGNQIVALDPRAIGSTMTLSTTPASARVERAPTVGTKERERGSVIAVLRIHGPLEQRATEHWCGFTDGYDAIESRFREALADPAVGAVLLEIDSPGGHAAGCFEATESMRSAKAASGKKVVAYAEELAASAAYSLATVADEIYLPRAGRVGSIGVRLSHVEFSEAFKREGWKFTEFTTGKKKALGANHQPLSDADKTELQARVDQLGELFVESVSAARGLTAKQIYALEAGVFMGEDAVKAKLADGVKTKAEVAALMVDHLNINRKRQEETMSLTAILTALSVETPDAALGKIAQLQESAAAAKDAETKIAALNVRIADFEAAEAARVETAKGDSIVALIAKGEAEGKVTPANKPSLTAKAQKHGVEWLKDTIEELPKVFSAQPVAASKKAASSTILAPEVLEKLKEYGLNEDDYHAAHGGQEK